MLSLLLPCSRRNHGRIIDCCKMKESGLRSATLAQLVERLIRNQQVAGSIPAGGSRTSLKTKDFPEPSNLRTLHLSSNCAKTVPKPLHAASPVPEFPLSFALRFSLARASRFICSFICEYFLNTFASPWRRSWVTHSSATPPALKRVAYVDRRS